MNEWVVMVLVAASVGLIAIVSFYLGKMAGYTELECELSELLDEIDEIINRAELATIKANSYINKCIEELNRK